MSVLWLQKVRKMFEAEEACDDGGCLGAFLLGSKG